MSNLKPNQLPRARRSGFTLIESLMAAGLLLAIVAAVTAAISAGQQHAYEAQQRIIGTLAAEELMGRLIVADYDDLPTWHGFTEPVGTMTDLNDQPLSMMAENVGRSVEVQASRETIKMQGVNVIVDGRVVTVTTFDVTGSVLAELNRFIPEPQS